MGWAKGSYVAQELYDRIRKSVKLNDREFVAKTIYELFSNEDADDWDPKSMLCVDGDLYQDGDD